MISKYLTLRVWILIAFLVFSAMAINPRPWNVGVEIKHVDEDSLLFTDGLAAGEIIKSVNGQSIINIDDYNDVINKLKVEPKSISVETDKVVVTVPSTIAGRVNRLLVAPGEIVRVGQAILEVE